MKQCPVCGLNLPEDAVFCPQCGTKIKTDTNNHLKKRMRLGIILFLTVILCVISFASGMLFFKKNNTQQQAADVSSELAGGQPYNNLVNNSTITKEDSGIDIPESRNEQVLPAEEAVIEEENSGSITERSITVVIDPGRGGDNVGRQVNRNGAEFSEKDINLRIGMFLREELQRYENINVVMTRENDIKVELEDRVKIASDCNADMLISLHNDTHGDVEDYQDGCLALTTSGVYRPELAQMETELAASILRELSGLGLTDRGMLIREAENGVTYDNGQNADYYAIIRNGVIQNVPSILIEHTCMDNPGDFEKYLSTDDALRTLAKADAEGIANYYGLNEKVSGNKCGLDPLWRETITFFRRMSGYEHNIPVYNYAVSTFGEEAGWRPLPSLNWKWGLPNTNPMSEAEIALQETLPESGSYQGVVDFSYFGSNDIDTTRRMGMSLGLAESKSEKFNGYYAEGDQIEIGINERGTQHPYRIINNDGNLNFTIHGIRIGMDATDCRTLLNENYQYFSTENNEDGTEYDIIAWAEYGSLKFVYGSDGKLRSWHEYLIDDSSE